MFNWRNAIGLAFLFGIVALVYMFGFRNFWPSGTDYTGFTMLFMLGIAMAFGFIVLLRSSRDL